MSVEQWESEGGTMAASNKAEKGQINQGLTIFERMHKVLTEKFDQATADEILNRLSSEVTPWNVLGMMPQDDSAWGIAKQVFVNPYRFA